MVGKGKQNYSDKNLHSTTFSAMNPSWTALELNLGFQIEKPASN